MQARRHKGSRDLRLRRSKPANEHAGLHGKVRVLCVGVLIVIRALLFWGLY